MDNPFRAPAHHHPPPSTSRRLWNFCFVAALGLSVLWLSWTLLLDDGDSSLVLDDDFGTVIDEDLDTKALNKETRLRTKKHEIGEVNDDDDIFKSPPIVEKGEEPEHEDEEEEDENIGDDHHDDDTMTHDDKINRLVEETKKKAELKAKSTPPPSSDLEDEEIDHEEETEETGDHKSSKSKNDKEHLDEEEDDLLKPPPKQHPNDEDHELLGDENEEDDSEFADHRKDTSSSSSKGKKQVKHDEETEIFEEEDHQEHAGSPRKPQSSKDKGDAKKSTSKLQDEEDLNEEEHPAFEDEEDEHLVPSNGKKVKSEKKPVTTTHQEDDTEDDEPHPAEREHEEEDDEPHPAEREHEEDEEEDLPPPPMPGDDEEDEGLEMEEHQRDSKVDEEDEFDAPIDSSRKRTDTKEKKPIDSKLRLDEDEEIEEHLDTEKAEEFEEDNEVKVPAKPLKQQTKDQSSSKKSAPVVEEEEEEEEEEAENEIKLGEREQDDEDHFANDDEETNAEEEQPIKKVPELPSQTAEIESDDEFDATPKVIVPCESLRKKVDCDDREECKWKFPKSETTGFFCTGREHCTDASVQRKSKCLSHPKCAWVRVSHSSYGCRDATAGSSRNEEEDDAIRAAASAVDQENNGQVSKKPSSEDETMQSGEEKTDDECNLHVKKAKCVGDAGCSWVRISTSPTTYGCRATRKESTEDTTTTDESTEEKNDLEENDQVDLLKDVDEDEQLEKANPNLPSLDDEEDIAEDEPRSLPKAPLPNDSEDEEEEAGRLEIDDDNENMDEESTEEATAGKKLSESEEGGGETGEEKENADATSAPLLGCSSVRVKSMCQVRTDCYWKYPVSKSSGKYCVERKLEIKVPQERSQVYESMIKGRALLYDDEKMQSPRTPASSRFKTHGPDWKRHRSDVSCALHPECVARDNATQEYFPNFPGLTVTPTYVKAECCANHPSLRALFFQVTDFLNREGIAWWLSADDIMTTLFADGFMLPWAKQITIEVPIFGSQTALDWAAKNPLRANLTSYSTTKTRVLRSTKNEFASKLLNFNADTQHIPNSMQACFAKYIVGGKKPSSSYSPDWLKSERSGSEECLIITKSTKISSSKTPIKFVVTHVDDIELKRYSVHIVPRIFRTASSDTCVEAWRPGADFNPVPIHMVFPTVPCFGQGKFQGFTGVARCPRDTKAFLALQSVGKNKPDFFSESARTDLDEFRGWIEHDYCARGISKAGN